MSIAMIDFMPLAVTQAHSDPQRNKWQILPWTNTTPNMIQYKVAQPFQPRSNGIRIEH